MTGDTQQLTQTVSGQDAKIAIIKEVIDEIRPNLIRDGGDCQFVSMDGNKVVVKLTGACVMCKLSSATLEGIQAKVIEKLGEFVRLVPAMGGMVA
jgi:Fe-S cluster biogenesis protein NfuA